MTVIRSEEGLRAALGIAASAGPDEVRAALAAELDPLAAVYARHFPELVAAQGRDERSTASPPAASDPFADLRKAPLVGLGW